MSAQIPDQLSQNSDIGQTDTELEQRIKQLEQLIAGLKDTSHGIKSTQAVKSCPDFGRHDAEVHLRRFIDSNIIPIHRPDIFGNVHEANDAFLQLLGFSRKELLEGKIKWSELTPPEFGHLDQAAVKQIKEKGKAELWEKQYTRKDGSRASVLLGVVSADNTGRDCLALSFDLTERKLVEARLKEGASRFRLLAEAVPHIVWICRSSGRLIYANRRFYDYTGIRPEEDDGLLWLRKVVHPDDRDRIMETALSAERTRDALEMEVRYRCATGQYHWHLVRALPMVDETTNRLSWFGTSTDIDDQKRVHEELAESESRFRTLADAIPQIVWTASPDGEINFFNHRWFEYTGLTLEQSENNGWQLLIHPDDVKGYMNGWVEAIEKGTSYEVEFRLKRALGIGKASANPYRWHLGRAVPLRAGDGTVTKWFATWTEIKINGAPRISELDAIVFVDADLVGVADVFNSQVPFGLRITVIHKTETKSGDNA